MSNDVIACKFTKSKGKGNNEWIFYFMPNYIFIEMENGYELAVCKKELSSLCVCMCIARVHSTRSHMRIAPKTYLFIII